MKALRNQYIEVLGSAANSPLPGSRIENAAHLKACAELARHRFLNCEGSEAELVRLKNLAARAERALGIPKPKAKPAGDMNLSDYLKNKAAAKSEGA